MENTGRVSWKIGFLGAMVITAWFLAAAFSRWGNHAVFSFPQFSMDDRSLELLTSTEFRYQDRFEKTLSRYARFKDMYLEEMSTAVPGLEYTNMEGAGSTQMVPQGICIAGDYMLITAYDNEKLQKSVIYVLSNGAGVKNSFLTTIVLPDKNHVGGIAFDGQNIWIAKSTSGYCSRISMEEIELAVASGSDCYRLDAYAENVYCGVTASFVTCYAGRLWVGTYRSRMSGKGMLSCYRLVENENGTGLQWEYSMDIPSCAQGISFVEQEGRSYMMLTTSCGRYCDSTVYLYGTVLRDSGMDLRLCGRYQFPPMAEELVSDGTNTYFLFESAATCYSTNNYRKCSYPVDRVCAISTQDLLSGMTKAPFRSKDVDAFRRMQDALVECAYFDDEKYIKIQRFFS